MSDVENVADSPSSIADDVFLEPGAVADTTEAVADLLLADDDLEREEGEQ